MMSEGFHVKEVIFLLPSIVILSKRYLGIKHHKVTILARIFLQSTIQVSHHFQMRPSKTSPVRKFNFRISADFYSARTCGRYRERVYFHVSILGNCWRTIIISNLFRFIHKKRFQMETIQSVIVLLNTEDYLATIDLKDAYVL